ncbi:MAG: O-acetylhomoserine aminocarboxypropyltransferase/cysteine synthase [Candidatus Spechtbacteria bacterium]|nr:O-acetylhomoserine aminocarboxypropyltransferase/cysteine synthase [Candidatus Spechtbacteria bacterium]
MPVKKFVPKLRSKKKYSFATKALHSGYKAGVWDASLVPPLYLGVAHEFESTKFANDVFTGRREGFVYGRINNPTCDIFEKRMAELENGEAAIGTASGMAAIFVTSIALSSAGDEIVSSDRVYGGTFHLFSDTLPRLGIKVNFVKNPHAVSSWEAAITPKTKFLYVETPSNPVLDVFDIEMLANLANKHHLPLVVDSTIASPALTRPIELGADIVAHSATKYICGNSTALGGVIVGKKALIDGIRVGVYRDIGPTLAPMNAWLMLNGLGTLAMRMENHSRNAQAVAEFLQAHHKISRVFYPGLSNSPYRALVDKQMQGNASALLAFEMKGTKAGCSKFIEALELTTHAAHLGDIRTLAIHPASTTHEQLSAEAKKKAHISDTLVRMSIGLEDVGDIIADIRNALTKV